MSLVINFHSALSGINKINQSRFGQSYWSSKILVAYRRPANLKPDEIVRAKIKS